MSNEFDRRIRYAILVNGELVQCNAQHKHAVKRAKYILADTKGWPNAAHVAVVDMWNGRPQVHFHR